MCGFHVSYELHVAEAMKTYVMGIKGNQFTKIPLPEAGDISNAANFRGDSISVLEAFS